MSTFATSPQNNSLCPLRGVNDEATLTSDRQSTDGRHDLSDDETKKDGLGERDVPVLTSYDDSESSIDLEEKGTGAVVLPWRVKVPALVLVIFFTRKPSSHSECPLSLTCHLLLNQWAATTPNLPSPRSKAPSANKSPASPTRNTASSRHRTNSSTESCPSFRGSSSTTTARPLVRSFRRALFCWVRWLGRSVGKGHRSRCEYLRRVGVVHSMERLTLLFVG